MRVHEKKEKEMFGLALACIWVKTNQSVVRTRQSKVPVRKVSLEAEKRACLWSDYVGV